MEENTKKLTSDSEVNVDLLVMPKPTKIIMFGNGNVFAASKRGEQIPELQKSWMQLYCEFLEKNNVDPTEVEFDLPMGIARVFKCEDESGTWYNWQM
ncbi:MAG: hypothetical protein FD143_3323 [Ignavibacteria bacterium]|nr:MAG: hypothetical protein FD143_3323 [Ignavibacteria bacterium]